MEINLQIKNNKIIWKLSEDDNIIYDLNNELNDNLIKTKLEDGIKECNKLICSDLSLLRKIFRIYNCKNTLDYSNKFIKILIFDIETTGTKIQNIIQIAYYVCDIDLNILEENNILINDGSNKQDYYKKISLFEIHSKGYSPNTGLTLFNNKVKECHYYVGHNLKRFDIPIVEKCGLKYKVLYDFNKNNIIDTMDVPKELLNLKMKTGGLKSPKLSELYKYLYNEEPDTTKLHLANYDIEITLLCLKELLNRKIFNEI